MAPSTTHDAGRAFEFFRLNQHPGKPRARGVTETRGPDYTPIGRRHLQDVLETMGGYVDALTFAGGSFACSGGARGSSNRSSPSSTAR
jgi:phosphosulfolactate synthase (CoM biosynthesis protein A)